MPAAGGASTTEASNFHSFISFHIYVSTISSTNDTYTSNRQQVQSRKLQKQPTTTNTISTIQQCEHQQEQQQQQPHSQLEGSPIGTTSSTPPTTPTVPPSPYTLQFNGTVTTAPPTSHHLSSFTIDHLPPTHKSPYCDNTSSFTNPEPHPASPSPRTTSSDISTQLSFTTIA